MTELDRTLAQPSDSIVVTRIALTDAAGKRVYEDAGPRITIGSHELNDVVLDDATVSRFHCELRLDGTNAIIVDLGSTNGTHVDGLRVREAFLRSRSAIRLGAATLKLEVIGTKREPVEGTTRFGALVGTSPAMRRTLALLAKAAASDVTLLLEGETGTGKGRAAEAVHRASARTDGPFVVVDCGAIPESLLESELFGHEKGAFTSAHERRIGAFEEASGGTLFLDEIGEIAPELQPKLLRALENREVRRVGSNKFIPVDLRVIAATNRDLRAEVNANRFRSDLYYRLAVARLVLPPLRERREDIPAIVDELLVQIGAPAAAADRLRTAAFLQQLQRGEWRGNARELRNHLESAIAFADDELVEPVVEDAPTAAPVGELMPFTIAKKRAQDAFERAYLLDLLARFDRITTAATAANVDRGYLYRMFRKHGLKPRL